MNQKDAVFEAVKQIKPTEVETDKPVVLSKQEKIAIQQKLLDGFQKGKIQYNNELPSNDKLELYISGLISNWLRKDRRLNGDTTYVPRRPGSRTGIAPADAHAIPSTSEQELIKKLVDGGNEVRFYVVRAAPKKDEHESGQDSTHVQE